MQLRRFLVAVALCALFAFDGARAQAAGETVLYADDFALSIPPDGGLGPNWNLRGLWYSDGNAVSDLNDVDQALETPVSCDNCRVEAQIGFAGPETGLSLRAATPDDRYDAVLLGDGTLRLRRVRAGLPVTLAEAPSGLADPTASFTLSLSATGANPVQLVAGVNGVPVAAALDTDPAALASGPAGLWTLTSSVRFATFRLYGPAGPPPPPGTDWPYYRRDLSGTGASPEALTTAQARGLHQLFQVHLPGSDANPVVVGNALYLTVANGTLVSLDATTGATNWVQQIGTSVKSACVPWVSGPIGAAAVSGQSVFAPGGDGLVYAFDKDSGAPLWSTRIADTAANDFIWSSVFPVNGRLYLGVATLAEVRCGENPGFVVSLDQATGAVLGTWYADANRGEGGGVWTSPSFDPRTGRLFVTTGTVARGALPETKPWQQAFVAIDPTTMQTLDSFQPVKTDFYTDWDFGASPTLYDLADGRHLIAAANKNGFVYALDRDNLAGGPLWTSLISGSGASPDLGESTIVSAAYANGRLFVGGAATTDGFAGAIASLDPATGTQQWIVHPDGFVLPAMSAVGDVVIAGVSHSNGNTGTLWVLDQQTGELLYTLQTPARLFSQATWANGTLYVTDEQGNLFALRP